MPVCVICTVLHCAAEAHRLTNWAFMRTMAESSCWEFVECSISWLVPYVVPSIDLLKFRSQLKHAGNNEQCTLDDLDDEMLTILSKRFVV